jgi:hypothetical protein
MEKEYLLTANQGRGILIMDNDHQELEVVASPKEHELITTNPDEAIAKEKPKQDHREDIEVNLDIEKGLFFGVDLTEEEKNYLTAHKYDVGYHVRIGKVKQEEVWVKTNKVESIDHTFLVQNIKLELQKYFKEIKINIVEKADLVVKTKHYGEIALEVETGSGYKKNKKELIKKFSNLQDQYGKRLYIVLTDSQIKRQYQKLFPKIKIIIRHDIPKLATTLYKKKNTTRKKSG